MEMKKRENKLEGNRKRDHTMMPRKEKRGV